jgi:hypothetical protein
MMKSFTILGHHQGVVVAERGSVKPASARLGVPARHDAKPTGRGTGPGYNTPGLLLSVKPAIPGSAEKPTPHRIIIILFLGLKKKVSPRCVEFQLM